MKDQILKIAKVKSEKEFYKKYPNEEAFMAKHGKALKKAAMGTKMVNKQLTQLTDWSNPPQAANGWSNVANALGAFTTPGKAATPTTAATPASGGLGDTLQGIFGKGDPSAFGKNNPNGALGKGGQGLGAGAKEAGIGVLNAAPQILNGIGAIQEQKKAIKKADQSSQVSGVVAQAAESRDISKPKNQYVRPEDQPAMGAMNPQGTGTNFLAQYGAQIGGNPTEIQNMYNPGDLYSDLGYEPLNDSNVKQFAYGGNLPTAEFGDYFQDSGQAQIGGAVGEAIGSKLFGPLGGMAGKFLGKVGGNLLGGAKDANELARYQDTTRKNTERAAMQQGAQAMQSANSSFMEDGGWMNPEYNPQMIAKFGDYSMKQLLQPPHDADMLRAGGHLKEYTPPSAEAMYTGRDELPKAFLGFVTAPLNIAGSMLAAGALDQGVRAGAKVVQDSPEADMIKKMVTSGLMKYGGQMAMGGDLQVHRGKAEPISYNPFLPDNGETVMFKGPSHDDGGMPISYGQNGVEVEGGEPAVKLADGGSPDGSLVVFGNMKIDDMAANHIGVEAAKGKKYKRFIDDLSKFESRQNKVAEKGVDLINSANTNDPFEQLSMNAGRAMMMGSNAKLLNAAIIKQRAAGVQNAILDTAKEYGVKSDELSKGKFVKDKNSDMAKFGAKMETAQYGDSLPNGPLDGVIRPSRNAQPPLFARMLGARASSEDPNNYNAELLQQLLNQSMYKGPSQAAAVTPFTKENMLAQGFKDSNNRAAAIVASAPSTRTASAPSAPSAKVASAPSAKGTAKGTAKEKGKGKDENQLRRLDVENMPNIIPASRNLTPSQLVNLPKGFAERAMASAEGLTPVGPSKDSNNKFDWQGLGESVMSNVMPLFRPTDQEELDPSQLYPEMFALASNQLEPVRAQQFQPMLKEAYNISLQDQLNEVDSQVRAATRQLGSNPAAAAQIFAAAADAKNKIRGEQMRMNQAQQTGIRNENIAALNQAQMQNLQILDQQYGRQAEAKSKTKAQTLEALKSIAAKTAQNKLENRQLGVMENMYNFRFGPRGQAINYNDPQQFNMQGVGKTPEEIRAYASLIEAQNNAKSKKSTEQSRNGSIVKALKTL